MICKGLSSLETTLEKNRNEANAKQMKKYMRDQFAFLGLKAPERKQLSNQFISDLPFNDGLENLIRTLWDKPEREYQYIAIDYLIKHKKHLQEKHIPLLQYIIMTKSWWDTIDSIASHLVGSLFQNFPHLIKEVGAKWLQSENIWLQRVMIIFQLKYKDKTDEALLFSTIQQLKHIDEFFIQKAIGWALREYSKTNPDSVTNFIEENELSNLVRREGLKHIKRKKLQI